MSILLLLALTVQALAGNPGVLISVPFPLSVPEVTLGLPLPLNDTLIRTLELSHLRLTQLDYTWTFEATGCKVNVTQAEITFDWVDQQHSGSGHFT